MAQAEYSATAAPLVRQTDWLGRYRPRMRVSEQGSVVSVGDGIAWIKGLPSAAMEEILSFADGSHGVVFHLTEDLVGVIMLHQTAALTAGATVRLTGRSLSIPVDEALLGRVIDPLGSPLDGRENAAAGRTWKLRRHPSWRATSCMPRCTPASRSSTP